MASSGKKGKKTKGKTWALTEFLQETPGETPTLPIRKSNSNWADEVEDLVDQYDRPKTNVVLPTAPKASRGYDDFSEKIPQNPPYLAYLSNLPYDVTETEIAELFANLRIAGMRMPKEGDGQKLRGFGYVEFEDPDSLIGALSMTDCNLKNRRIRIEVATNNENDRRRGRNDNNRDRPERPEVTSGDWRSGPRAEPTESDRSERTRVGYSRDRDDKDKGSSGGSWRDSSDRPSFRESDSRTFNRDSDRRFGDRDGDKRGLSRRSDRDDFTRGARDDPPSEARTRTKLILAPRSVLDAAEVIETPQPTPVPVPAASIFGNAKPVDTSLREREIESRLLAKQAEKPPIADSSREIRRDAWGKQNEQDGKGRRSPQRRSSLDRSPSRYDRDRRRSSLDRRSSPIRRIHSPAYKRNSPDRRRSPENRRRSPQRRWRSPERRRSPGRSPDGRYSPVGRSPERRPSPERKRSPDRRHSLDKRYSSDSSSLSYNRRYSPPPRNYSPESTRSPTGKDHRSPPIRRKLSDHRRASPELGRRSPEIKRSPERKKYSPEHNRAAVQHDRRTSSKVDKTSQKNDKDKHRREDKASRDNHDRDMPKLKEPEPLNFVASNKYASLEADDSE